MSHDVSQTEETAAGRRAEHPAEPDAQPPDRTRDHHRRQRGHHHGGDRTGSVAEDPGQYQFPRNEPDHHITRRGQKQWRESGRWQCLNTHVSRCRDPEGSGNIAQRCVPRCSRVGPDHRWRQELGNVGVWCINRLLHHSQVGDQSRRRVLFGQGHRSEQESRPSSARRWRPTCSRQDRPWERRSASATRHLPSSAS